MPGARKPPQPRSALPEENDWVAERAALEEQPAGGPTPKESPRRPTPPDQPSPTGPQVPQAVQNVSDNVGQSVKNPTLKLPTSMPSAGDVASLLTGLLLYTLFLNYMRYGPTGVTGWFRAKFLNDPIDPASLSGTAIELGSNQAGGINLGPIAPLGSPISTT